MSDIRLTKDSDMLMCVLYKAYLQARKNGSTKREARCFGGASDIQQKLMPQWPLADVEETLWSLKRTGLIFTRDGDNTVLYAMILDDGILYMENRFKSGMTELLDYISKIKTFLP